MPAYWRCSAAPFSFVASIFSLISFATGVANITAKINTHTIAESVVGALALGEKINIETEDGSFYIGKVDDVITGLTLGTEEIKKIVLANIYDEEGNYDNARALDWYIKSAEAGYLPACNQVGNYYYFGFANKQDYMNGKMRNFQKKILNWTGFNLECEWWTFGDSNPGPYD